MKKKKLIKPSFCYTKAQIGVKLEPVEIKMMHESKAERRARRNMRLMDEQVHSAVEFDS